MTPHAAYVRLYEAGAATACDLFDRHVLACVFAAGIAECNSGVSLAEALGIGGAQLQKAVEEVFSRNRTVAEGVWRGCRTTHRRRRALCARTSMALPVCAFATQFAAVHPCRAQGESAESPMARPRPLQPRRTVQLDAAALRTAGCSQHARHEVEEVLFSHDLPE